jgi:DNA excision repair protein ERCC-4
MYTESVEEHRYINTLKRDKAAFEKLIQKKSTMVISLPDIITLGRTHDEELVPLSLDTRSNQISRGKAREAPAVVVDIREFGSSLPSLLHLHGFLLHPVTLLVTISWTLSHSSPSYQLCGSHM